MQPIYARGACKDSGLEPELDPGLHLALSFFLSIFKENRPRERSLSRRSQPTQSWCGLTPCGNPNRLTSQS